MNFDALDEDLDIGYTPTVASGSRSAGMKKLTKKPESKPTPIITKKNDDFDLLDDLLASPAKPKPVEKAKPAAKNNNEIDSFFDEPSLPMTSKNTTKQQKPIINAPIKPPVAPPPPATHIQDTILQEHEVKPSTSSFKFKRPQTPVVVNNPITTKKAMEELEPPEITISPSVRMMKPPLRKRESKEDLSKTTGGGLGLVLPEEPQKSTQSLAQEEKFSSIGLGNKRRSSIEMNTNQLSLTLDHVDPIGSKKPSIQGSSQNHMAIPNSNSQQKLNLFTSFQSERPKQNLEINQYQPKKQEQTLQPTKMQQKKQSSWQPDKSYQFKQPKPSKNQQITPQNAPKPVAGVSHQQIEKQIEFIKRSYQKHIDSLQKNIQEQVKVNKDSRQRLMRQANTMIENERTRMKKVHDEEIDRINQMNEWEKKKIQENYKYQVESLRAQIDKLTSVVQVPKNTTNTVYNDRKQIQYLEQRLKAQKKLIEQRSRIYDKRQLDLEQRQKDLNKHKRLEQQRLRAEQRRIMQYEMDVKKQIINEKRAIEDEKQAMATELASLEMGNYRKTQDVELLRSQIDRQRAELDNEKAQLRKMNNNMLIEYQKKCQQLKYQKQRVAKLQAQLLNKIKVVQSTRQRLNTTNPVTTKQNNWVNNSTQNQPNHTSININDESFKKTMSMEKMSQQKKLEGTQNRFIEMTANLKESLKMAKKGKDFDLDGYLMSMAHYTRARETIK